MGEASLVLELPADNNLLFVENFVAPQRTNRKKTTIVTIAREGDIEQEFWIKRDGDEKEKEKEKGNAGGDVATLLWTLVTKGGNIKGRTDIPLFKSTKDSYRELWLIRLLNQHVSELAERVTQAMSNAGSSNRLDSKEVDKWSNELKEIQKNVETIQPFKVTREEREKMMQTRDNIQVLLNAHPLIYISTYG